MKSPLKNIFGTVGALSLAFAPSSFAESRQEVDTELLFLVDVSSSVSSENFNHLMLNYASAIESSEALTSIASGQNQSIAASMIFFSDDSEHSVGVDWSMINDYTSAKAFGETLRGLSLPNIGSELSNTSSALGFATNHFDIDGSLGSNAYTSNFQAIDILTDDFSEKYIFEGKNQFPVIMTSEDQAARDAAINAGVDTIRALIINENENTADYYKENVVYGDRSSYVRSEDYGEKEPRLSLITNAIDRGAVASFESVPEPSSTSLLGLGAISLILRRKR